MNKDKFFIGVGPFKTGSTWLYRTLEQHPEVTMPPIKELRYFFFVDKVIENKGMFTNLLDERCHFQLTRIWSKSVFKRGLKEVLNLNTTGLDKLYWVFRYFCLPHNDEWYKKLFSKNKVSGDISPLYSLISRQTIAKVKKLNPDTKIIIGLRNPIERTWSDLKMTEIRNRGKKNISEVKKSVILDFLNRNNKISSNDYASLITKWNKYFPKEQIFIYYFEELEENPQRLFNRICGFLKIQPIEIENIKKKVNKGIVEKIPAEYEKELIKLNYKYIEEFAEKHPNKYSLAWLEKYKKDI